MTSSGTVALPSYGSCGSFAEGESFRLRAGVRRMRSPVGTLARPRLPVSNGRV